jgi:hypothetical protein
MPSDLSRVMLEAEKEATHMGVRVEQPGPPIQHRGRVTILPTTKLGWWAAGLAAAFFPLMFAAAVAPRSAALGFVCGLAGGAIALMAIVRDRERAVTVLAAAVPLVIAVVFVLAQLISGNP